MKRLFIILTILATTATLLCSCSNNIENGRQAQEALSIFPDYKDVTIPANIAPLNFRIEGSTAKAQARFLTGESSVVVSSSDSRIIVPERKWRKIIDNATMSNGTIEVIVSAQEADGWVTYAPFKINVAPHPIDSHIAYRLIEPGYESWCEMGIYQRNIETFEQKPIIENSAADYGCINCHSFCQQNPDKMLFHMRQMHTGTIITDGTKIEKLNTTTPETRSPLVYPSWHPSGKYVAFTNNLTRLINLPNDHNRVEVYDGASDVVVYDVERHEIITSRNLFSTKYFETFPTFSPDGGKLYFCTADSVAMPDEFKSAKYSLCAIDFDEETRRFGERVDTLYNAHTGGRSVSFPRVSPDGRYMLYALADYGNFSIWHRDADLKMIDLTTGNEVDMAAANSDAAESYHSWSSNSRWILFNSRRVNGLYTHAYIAYVDEQGKVHKPFLLPQRDPDFYDRFMKSYNIPEFITGEVELNSYDIAQFAKEDKGIDLKFKMQE